MPLSFLGVDHIRPWLFFFFFFGLIAFACCFCLAATAHFSPFCSPSNCSCKGKAGMTKQTQIESAPLVSALRFAASLSSANKPLAKSRAGSRRTSMYRGVTKHRWASRYEAHLWDNSWVNESGRKGKQIYLGGYDTEEKAARAYDLAALKYWGPSTTLITNFPIEQYAKEIEEMKTMTRKEYVAYLKRNSSGFARGASQYRGVTRHHCEGRWQARIGRVRGSKDVYLGTFTSEEEAAEAYDIAALKLRGRNAVTNFDISRYDLEAIQETTLPFEKSSSRRSKNIPTLPMLASTSSGSSQAPTLTFPDQQYPQAPTITFPDQQHPQASTFTFTDQQYPPQLIIFPALLDASGSRPT